MTAALLVIGLVVVATVAAYRPIGPGDFAKADTCTAVETDVEPAVALERAVAAAVAVPRHRVTHRDRDGAVVRRGVGLDTFGFAHLLTVERDDGGSRIVVRTRPCVPTWLNGWQFTTEDAHRDLVAPIMRAFHGSMFDR